MKEVRTRFAPSPTGFMHIGNLRSALYEYLVAKSQNGKFILRIEDTDQKREVEGAVQVIYDTLKVCNMHIDEGPQEGGNFGPYTQSERVDLYKKYAQELVDKGEAYYCFCTEERLEKLREEADIRKVAFMYDGHCLKLSKEEIEEKLKNGEPYVIRQKMPKEGSTSYEDLVYGKITVENKLLEDQILLKSDGYPTYNFANVIDDHLMEITHVVRGNEYLSSTPKYLLLYKAFGWESPEYIHLPHIIKEGGKKISKRDGDSTFMDLYNLGYLPEAIINYLALLGWSPADNQEIFSMDELIEKFDVKRINNSPAVYDIKKLDWINAHYIKELSKEDFKKLVLPFLEKEYDLSTKSTEWLDELLSIYQNHISNGSEIVEEVKLFFNNEYNPNEEAQEFMKQDGIDKTIDAFREEINNITEWTIDNISNAINNTKEKSGNKGKMLFMPIRIKTSGQMHGPELANTIYLLGEELVKERLK
ncbi:MAG: glutamate--tRNA ligase [Bacilli bacterium]|nr:glutamate--tRNA ligase [Bacilli bacterium]